MMFQLPSYTLIPHNQVSSPHLLDSPSTTAPHVPPPQVTSPHVSSPQTTTPHLFPQTTSPHLPQPHPTPPHYNQPQISSSYLPPHHQATSPLFSHPYGTSPNLVPQPEVTSPHFVAQPQTTSPHLLPLPQYHVYNQSLDPGFNHPDWSRAESSPELSYLQKSDGYSYQNQTTSHLDLHLINENQYSAGVTHQQGELENAHRLSYNTQTPPTTLYQHSDTSGPVQDTWRPPGPALKQVQCSPQASGEVTMGRWTTVDFSSSSAEESSSAQFYQNNAPQPYCRPTTPGLSPHYPQTPTIPSPQIHPKEERLDFHTQTSGQLSGDKTLSCLHGYGSYPRISDPPQHHPHQTSQHHFLQQSELIQDQMGVLDTTGNSESYFSLQVRGQEVSSAAQSPGLPAQLSCRDERGGGGVRGGGGGGGGGGGNIQPDLTRKKRPQTKNSTKVQDSRLVCTVCKRAFRSLPALNGHMRSHSGSRSVRGSNKSEDPALLAPPSISMVTPVAVPDQSSGPPKASRSSQRRCTQSSPVTKHAVLYPSLLHQQRAASGGGEVTGGSVRGGHYTPPPMLCPLRAGTGLYCSLTTRTEQRVQTVQFHSTHDDLVTKETASPPPGTLMTQINKPRINVGRGFQAEIPPLRRRTHAHTDSHNALLLWTMPDKLEHPVNQQRVDALLMMARSSVVPGGGANADSALHVLSECRGDFLLTVEKLLSPPETCSNTQTAQQNKNVSWSAAERLVLLKSLQLHHKDFSSIQKAVQTKSLSECVEFYYLWKKKVNLNVKKPAGLTVVLPETNGHRSPKVT